MDFTSLPKQKQEKSVMKTKRRLIPTINRTAQNIIQR